MSDQNDKSFLDKVINSYVHPFIKPPFPPLIDPKDLISKSIVGNKPNRAPNAFIIYRKMYVREARNEGYCFPMTVLSSIVSQSWEKEPEEVKIYYKKLAKEAFDYRNELFPRPESKKKKRSNWNVISFEKNYNDKKESTSNPSVPIQLPFSTDNNNDILVSNDQFDNQTELDFINQISTPDLSHESSTTTSPIIDDPADELINSQNIHLINDMEYMDSCQQSFENFQQEINFYDHFTNRIIDNDQIQNFDVLQNQEIPYNESQLDYCQTANPNVLSFSSPDVLGIFECNQELELASNLQPVYFNTIPDNTCVFNQQSYNISESFDYSFY
jgi:hypothetical protein